MFLLLQFGVRGLLGMLLVDGETAEDLGYAAQGWGNAIMMATVRVPFWSDGHLRRWARRVGAAAPPDPKWAADVRPVPGPVATDDLYRQRPAWMVAFEAAAVGAALAGAAAEHFNPCCGGASAGGPGAGSNLFTLIVTAAFGAFMALTWWDWWRAGGRGA